jgi:SAM-dependent methyltransferase
VKEMAHWCRIVMNEANEEFVRSLQPATLDALEISGEAWKDKGFRSYRNLSFPAFDICADRTRTSYDLIIIDQVLEHVRYPSKALKNLYGMLKNGAVIIVGTPSLIRYHPMPLDLWRWTQPGLKALLGDAGFSDLETFSWGNRKCVSLNLDLWISYDPTKHSLENEPYFPLVVWGHGRRTKPRTVFDWLRGAYSETIYRHWNSRKRPVSTSAATVSQSRKRDATAQ